MVVRRDKRFDHPYFARYTEKEFAPYMLALGQVIVVWNDTYSSLGAFYIIIMGIDLIDRFEITWNVINSDRLKRTLLAKVLDESTVLKNNKNGDYIKSEINWILKELNSMEDKRNDFVHSPVYALRFHDAGGIYPPSAPGHRRAENLSVAVRKQKNLISELRHYRDKLTIYERYIRRINYYLYNEQIPLPSRPKLPPSPGTMPPQPRPQAPAR